MRWLSLGDCVVSVQVGREAPSDAAGVVLVLGVDGSCIDIREAPRLPDALRSAAAAFDACEVVWAAANTPFDAAQLATLLRSHQRAAG